MVIDRAINQDPQKTKGKIIMAKPVIKFSAVA